MPYLRNKRTGETIFVPDGPQQAVPAAPLKVQGAQADIGSTQAGTARTRGQEARDAALFELNRRKLAADAASAEAGAVEAKRKNKGQVAMDSTRAATLKDRMTALSNLEQVLGNLEGQYASNFKGKPLSRGFGLTELLPGRINPANQKFNSTALRAGPFIQSILGLGSKEADAAAEYERKVLPFIPTAGEFDDTTEDKLRMLNDFLNKQRAATYRNLGQTAPKARRSALDRQQSRTIDFNDLPE